MSKTKVNFVFNLIGILSTTLFPLITFPYVTRVLLPDGIGLVNFADAFSRYFVMFAALGIPIYGVREIARVASDKKLLDKEFSEIFLIHFISSCVLTLVYIFIVLIIPRFDDNRLIFLLSGASIFFSVFTAEWLYSGLEEFKFITLRSLLIKILSVFAIFIFVKTENDTLILVVIGTVMLVLTGFVNMIFLLKKVNFDFKGLNLIRHIKPLTLIFSSTIAVSVYILLDTVMLGFLTDERSVGLYTASIKLNKMSLSFVTALGVVLIPKISALLESRQNNSVQEIINKSLNYILFSSVPITFGIFILAPDLIKLLAGGKFSAATLSTRILSFLPIIIGLSNLFGMQILITLRKDREFLYAVLVGTVTNFTLNLILIPAYGVDGAAVSTIIAEIFVTLSCLYFARQYYFIRIPYKNLTHYISYSLLFYPIYLTVQIQSFNNILQVLTTILTCVLVYSILNIFVLKNPLILELLKKFKIKLEWHSAD